VNFRYEEDTELLLKQMREYLAAYWGTKCSTYEPDCAQCKTWAAYEQFKAAVE